MAAACDRLLFDGQSIYLLVQTLEANLSRVMRHLDGIYSRHRRGERNEARAIAIYIFRKIAGMRQEEIAEAFGVSGYSAVSSAVGGMQEQIEKGGEIVGWYQRIQQLLQR